MGTICPTKAEGGLLAPVPVITAGLFATKGLSLTAEEIETGGATTIETGGATTTIPAMGAADFPIGAALIPITPTGPITAWITR